MEDRSRPHLRERAAYFDFCGFSFNLYLLLSVGDDYLLPDYYYAVVWRASRRKRVMRDYDYLDYFVSASRARPILTSVRPSGRARLSWKVGSWGDLRLFLCRPPRQFLVLLDGRIERKLIGFLVKIMFFAISVVSDSYLIFCIRLFLFRFPSAA